MSKVKRQSYYSAPLVRVVPIETRQCIALSVQGDTESYSSSEEDQTEDFGYNDMGEF